MKLSKLATLAVPALLAMPACSVETAETTESEEPIATSQEELMCGLEPTCQVGSPFSECDMTCGIIGVSGPEGYPYECFTFNYMCTDNCTGEAIDHTDVSCIYNSECDGWDRPNWCPLYA